MGKTADSTTKGKPKAGVKLDRPLNHRQEIFARAYVSEAMGNGLLAAKQAGYKGSDNTLMVTATKLIRSGKVKAAIDREKAARARAAAVDAQWVLDQAMLQYQALSAPDEHGRPMDATNAKGYLDMVSRIIGAYEQDNRQRGPGALIIM